MRKVRWPTVTELPSSLTAIAGAPLSFLSFEGYISDVTFDFSLNSVVTSNVSIQVSGLPAVTAKA